MSESATEVCINQEVTFTANPSLALHCVEWEWRYREDEDANWTDWAWVAAGDTAELDSNTSNTPGEYQYRAFNGDSNSCATDVNSEIVTVVEVGDVNFSCTSVCIGGTCTASADIAPSGRDIEWTIPEPNLGCSIDANSGVITAGTTAGTITVKGADANVPSCSDSNQLDVVDVGTIEIKYDDANWADVTGANIVVLKGTKYLFRVWPDPEGASWPSSPQWSGAASGVGLWKLVTFNTEGSETVTVKCCSTCGDGKTVNVNVVEPNVCEVGFYGDYVLYETPVEWEGWADGVDEIPVPQYDCNMDQNFPVCVPMGSSNVGLWKVKLRVDEAITYTTAIKVDAGGTELWDESNDVNFPQASVLSDEAQLEITGSIVDQVKKYDNNFQIQWKYKVPSGTNTYYTINTTDHTLYVKYGNSTGGHSLTEERIKWLTDKCDGDSNTTDCAHHIHAGLASNPPDFELNDPGNPSNKWHMMDPNGPTGDCENLAMLMQDMHQLLGCGDGEIGYIYGSNDIDCYSTSSTAWQKKEPNCPNHGAEYTYFGYTDNWNLWEGVFKANGWYYPIKYSRSEYPNNVLIEIVGSNNPGPTCGSMHQAWQKSTSTVCCTNPGPHPVPLPASSP